MVGRFHSICAPGLSVLGAALVVVVMVLVVAVVLVRVLVVREAAAAAQRTPLAAQGFPLPG